MIHVMVSILQVVIIANTQEIAKRLGGLLDAHIQRPNPKESEILFCKFNKLIELDRLWHVDKTKSMLFVCFQIKWAARKRDNCFFACFSIPNGLSSDYRLIKIATVFRNTTTVQVLC